MKYICKFDDKIFVDRDDAWDHVIDCFTNEDFIDYTKKIGRFDEMIDGLMGHDFLLFQEIHGQAAEAFFENSVIVENENE